jgi:uncharacterized membrane protein YkoI
MLKSKRMLFVAVLVAFGVGVVSVPTATADEKDKVKKPEAEPGKPLIIQIDASKLPPEVLKELLKFSKASEPTKPGTKLESTKPTPKPESTKLTNKPMKTISLSDAIVSAEKATGGTAVKAEREDEDGKVVFEIEVIDSKGSKTEVIVDGSGNVLKTSKGEKGEEKGQKGEQKGEKGKKKEKDEDKDEKGKKKKEKDDDDDKDEKGEKGKKKKEKDD